MKNPQRFFPRRSIIFFVNTLQVHEKPRFLGSFREITDTSFIYENMRVNFFPRTNLFVLKQIRIGSTHVAREASLSLASSFRSCLLYCQRIASLPPFFLSVHFPTTANRASRE